MSELKNIVEAVLLAADTPLSVARIQGLFDERARPEAEEVKRALEVLQGECKGRGVELCKIGTGYRYQSRAEYGEWIRKLYAVRPPRMSQALLETLAIIAYRQPVTRGDIEGIRGVSISTEIIQRLRERGWIKEVGVRDLPGHPALLATTGEFLSWFGLGSLKDLPPLSAQREITEVAADLGISADLLEIGEERAEGQEEVLVGGEEEEGEREGRGKLRARRERDDGEGE